MSVPSHVQPTSAWWVRYGKGRRAEGGADVRELLQRTMYLQHLEVLDELRRPGAALVPVFQKRRVRSRWRRLEAREIMGPFSDIFMRDVLE